MSKPVYTFAYDEETDENVLELGHLKCDMIKAFLEDKKIKVKDELEYSEPGFDFVFTWRVLYVSDKDFKRAKKIVDRLKREFK